MPSDPAEYRISNIMKRLDRGGHDHALSRSYVMGLFRATEGVCPLSGLPFRNTDVPYFTSPYSPAFDRIEPAMGYIKGNVRFILQGLNGLKGNGTDADVFAICRAVEEKRHL